MGLWQKFFGSSKPPPQAPRAQIKIRTAEQSEKQALVNFKAIEALIGPRLVIFNQLSEDKADLWLRRDPLMHHVVRFAERVARAR